jgi:hypothetical protein
MIQDMRLSWKLAVQIPNNSRENGGGYRSKTAFPSSIWL